MTKDLREKDELLEKITKRSPDDKNTAASITIVGPQSILAAAAAKATMPGNTYQILIANQKQALEENSNEYKPDFVVEDKEIDGKDMAKGESIKQDDRELSEEKDLSKYCSPPLVGRGCPVTEGGLGADGFKSSGTCCKKSDNDISEDSKK